MTLTDAQRNALENLERKRQDKEVPYINISSALTLTDLGLAARNARGWDITPAGSAFRAPYRSTTANPPPASGQPRQVGCGVDLTRHSIRPQLCAQPLARPHVQT